MSWFARSIANSLKFDDDDDENHDQTSTNATDDHDQNPDLDQQSPSSSSNGENTPRGVREDLNDFTKTLTRQIWGVASFLAPPPPPDLDEKEDGYEEEEVIAGIKSDFAEISGKFKTGMSKLSSNIAVSEITKMASNFLQFGSEDEDMINAVGVNEDVLIFARNLALHPGTWLDFPVPNEDDFDDFDMSEAQQEHALAVEHFVPQLASLRIELCPGHMSEACFWKIYFVLMHPKLSEQSAKLLSTPQIVEARALFMRELQTQAGEKSDQILPGDGNIPVESSGLSYENSSYAQSESVPVKNPDTHEPETAVPVEIETEKHPIQSSEVQIVDKSVVEEKPLSQINQPSASSSSKFVYEQSEDDADDWLKEESSETVGVSKTSMAGANDEDLSFSDLEDEDDEDVPIIHKKTTSGSDSSTKDSSRDWVQLSRSSTDSAKDAKRTGTDPVSARNDWLDVDDIEEM